MGKEKEVGPRSKGSHKSLEKKLKLNFLLFCLDLILFAQYKAKLIVQYILRKSIFLWAQLSAGKIITQGS